MALIEQDRVKAKFLVHDHSWTQKMDGLFFKSETRCCLRSVLLSLSVTTLPPSLLLKTMFGGGVFDKYLSYLLQNLHGAVLDLVFTVLLIVALPATSNRPQIVLIEMIK